MDDWLLLSRYVDSGCQDSFQQIVTRHSGWVFSLSLRAVRDRHMAEDVTQAVFIVLARKARTIRQGTPLSGWLFKVSRFAVSDALKRRARIKNRENRFAEFFKANGNGVTALEGDNISDTVSQTLDEAVACLSESDRQVVLLRFYEHKSLAEIGTILEISEEAAKKRVARAVERLRKYFSTRGIIASVALLLLLLSKRSAEAAGGIAAAIGSGAAPTLANSIAEGAIQLMAHANARLLGAILAAGLALLVAVPTLGGALVRTIVATTAPATVAEAHPLPDAPSHSEAQKTINLPAEPRFTEVWIGYKGELLWRSDAFAGPKPTPFILRAAEKLEQPYAVALDARGNFFLKPLDHAILQSPVIRQATFDYDNGPIQPSARVESMMSTIELMAPGSGGSSGSGDAETGASSELRHRKILPKIDERKADDDWRKLHQEIGGDGTAIVSGFKSSTLSLPHGVSPDAGLNNDFYAPEPSSALLILGGTTLLVLRRRRRV